MHLSAVVPQNLGGRQEEAALRRIRSRTVHGINAALEARNRTKISRLGTYSSQRVEALEAYCQDTSIVRILVFCALTPWPALLLALLTELIPVEDPALGWKRNYGLWIRFFILITSAAAGTLCQLRAAIPDLSYWKIALVGLATGAGSSVAMMVCSIVWVFPLPFSFILMIIPMQMMFLGCLSAATYQKGSNNAVTSIENPGKRKPMFKIEKPLKQKVFVMISQSLLAIVYIIFGVVFTNCTPKQQIGLLVFMPVMKLALKHLVARLVSENESSIPAVVAFSVDVFNGLFSSICLQASASWWTSLAMITINTIRAVLSFLEINRSMRKLRELKRKHQSQTNGRKQVWGSRDSSGSRRSSSIITSAKWQAHSQKILVRQSTERLLSSTHLHSAQASSSAIHLKMKEISSQMLFHLEYLALVAYIESVVPLLYAVYLTILYQLPSAKYYPHSQYLTMDKLRSTIESIVAYASVEVVTLVLLHVLLKRRFGFSLMYQLAFVLENEMEQLQGRLFVWIIGILQLTLVHYGMDFTFTFAWMNSKPAS